MVTIIMLFQLPSVSVTARQLYSKNLKLLHIHLDMAMPRLIAKPGGDYFKVQCDEVSKKIMRHAQSYYKHRNL